MTNNEIREYKKRRVRYEAIVDKYNQLESLYHELLGWPLRTPWVVLCLSTTISLVYLTVMSDWTPLSDLYPTATLAMQGVLLMVAAGLVHGVVVLLQLEVRTYRRYRDDLRALGFTPTFPPDWHVYALLDVFGGVRKSYVYTFLDLVKKEQEAASVAIQVLLRYQEYPMREESVGDNVVPFVKRDHRSH